MKIGQLGANEATTGLIQMHFGITCGCCFGGGGGGLFVFLGFELD